MNEDHRLSSAIPFDMQFHSSSPQNVLKRLDTHNSMISMRFFATVALAILLLAGCKGPADVAPASKAGEAQKDATYQKEMEELRKSIKSDVKIKLKKDGKGTYSWEIQGKDPQEVLRVNDQLRKKLGD